MSKAKIAQLRRPSARTHVDIKKNDEGEKIRRACFTECLRRSLQKEAKIGAFPPQTKTEHAHVQRDVPS
jgi:hypothetical protein